MAALVLACVVVVVLAPATAGARAKPKFPKPPKFTLIFAEVSVAVSGSLNEHASRDCGSCAVGAFLNGCFNAGFSSKLTWKDVAFLLSGSLPGIPSPIGYTAQDAVTGTWNSPGQDFGGDGNPPTSFSCGGAVRDVHVTKAEFGLPVIVKTITPRRESLPSSDCTQWVSADHCNDSFNWTGMVRIEPNCEQISTGPVYSGLSAAMKEALGKLYAKLKSEKGCWHFTIGARTFSQQKDLYDRWHTLADHQQGNPDVCSSPAWRRTSAAIRRRRNSPDCAGRRRAIRCTSSCRTRPNATRP